HPGPFGGSSASKRAVQRVGVRYYVALFVYHSEVRRFGGFVARGVARPYLCARRGALGVNCLCEFSRVLLRRQPGYRYFHKIGVANELCSISERSALRFDNQMQGARCPRRHITDVVMLEYIEHLEERRASRGWRWHGHDLITAICPGERLPHSGLVFFQ